MVVLILEYRDQTLRLSARVVLPSLDVGEAPKQTILQRGTSLHRDILRNLGYLLHLLDHGAGFLQLADLDQSIGQRQRELRALRIPDR